MGSDETKWSTSSVTRRGFLRGAAGLAAVAATGLAGCGGPQATAEPTKATVAPTAAPPAKAGGEVIHMSWGGSYEENLYKAYFNAFQQETGIKVTAISPMTLAKLQASAKAGKMDVDSFDAGAMETFRAKNEKLILPVDYDVVKREGRRKEEMAEYGLGFHVMANQLVYSTKAFAPGKGPASWADFWDVKKFPGRRSLYKHPVSNLAFALMADGVAPDKVHPMDVDRAFKSLDRIKPYITVWWEQGAQSQQLFKDGEVDMMMLWNGRATDIEKQGAPVYQVWEESLSHVTYFMVTQGGPNPKGAQLLAEFFGRPKLQAEWAKIMWYGPLNAKAYDYIDAATAKKLPTSPENMKRVYWPDYDWWAVNFDAINQRFMTWLVK